jgi:hypothetical protein
MGVYYRMQFLVYRIPTLVSRSSRSFSLVEGAPQGCLGDMAGRRHIVLDVDDGAVRVMTLS